MWHAELNPVPLIDPYSGQVAHRVVENGGSGVSIAVTSISAIAFLNLALLPMLFQQLMEVAVSIKMVLSIILIAPLAFRMGMSFPI